MGCNAREEQCDGVQGAWDSSMMNITVSYGAVSCFECCREKKEKHVQCSKYSITVRTVRNDCMK